jgi:hypothetical protein
MKERDHLENIGIERRIILKCILNKQDGRAWTRRVWLKIRTSEGIFLGKTPSGCTQ